MFKKRMNLFYCVALFFSLMNIVQRVEGDEQRLEYDRVFDNPEVLSFHMTIRPESYTEMHPEFTAKRSN